MQVITSKDPADKFFRAYAVRCSEETRDVVLESEPCEDAQKAVQSLHTKSCEAIHSHIATNGFSGRRSLKPVFLEPDFEDDDAASIISGHSDSSTAAFSEWGSSGDETMMQKQNASDATETSKDRQRNAGRQGNRVSTTATGAHEPVGASRSRAATRDFSEYMNPTPPRARVARPGRSHSPSLATRQAPPPPPGHPGHHGLDGLLPPTMRGMGMPPPMRPFPSNMTMGPPSSRPQNVANLPMPSGQQAFPCFRLPGPPMDSPPFSLGHGNNRPPKPPSPNANNDGNNNRDGNGSGNSPLRPFPLLHSTMRFHTVRITVRWLRHGQHRIIAQCHPTREALQSAAVADVRMNPGAFTSDTKRAASPNGAGRGDGNRPNLRAQVRQAVFAGEAYDMRTFQGQDLTRLFNVMAAADDSMPSFEVVVEDVPRDAGAPRDTDDDDDETEDDGEASVRAYSGPVKVERWD